MKESAEDHLDPMIIVVVLAIVALIIIVVISVTARRSGNQTREQIFEHVQGHPGSNLNEIKETLKMKNRTLVHHLRKLEKKGLIESKKDNKFERFYPVEEEGSKENQIEEDNDEET